MTKTDNTYNQLIAQLQKNFLFQISLGSKELFHSNLLAWLMEQENSKSEPEVFKIFLNQFLDIEVENLSSKSIHVHREWNKIDLTLEWHEGDKVNFVFIENKLKSLPQGSQLADYNNKITEIIRKKRKDKIDKTSRAKFLLTPLPVGNKLQTEFTKLGWPNITYEEEILKFLHSIKKIDFKNKDLHLLIDRYILFLECLTQLLHKFNLGQGNLSEFKKRGYDFYNYDFIEEGENGEQIGLMRQIRNLRLHDLILKLAHQSIGELIREKLKSKSVEIVPSYGDLSCAGQVHISTNFTRSAGLTDVKFCIQKGFNLGLQIQGDTLKYLAEVNTKILSGRQKDLVERNIAFAFNLVKNELWFYEKLNGEVKLLNGKGRNTDIPEIDGTTTRFNSYGLNFIYLQKDLSEYHNKSTDELAELVASEIFRVVGDIKKFQKQIPN